jgi:hypothetical protein
LENATFACGGATLFGLAIPAQSGESGKAFFRLFRPGAINVVVQKFSFASQGDSIGPMVQADLLKNCVINKQN